MATQEQFYHHLGQVWIAGGGGSSGSVTNPDGTVSTIKSASIAATALGSNSLVAAVVGKKIRVLGFTLSASGAVNAKFQNATGTDISGLFYLAAAGASVSQPVNSSGCFETTVGAFLGLNLSAAVPVGGFVTYIEV